MTIPPLDASGSLPSSPALIILDGATGAPTVLGQDPAGRAMSTPADRRELPKGQPVKTTRWPRTDRRAARVAAVLARRQPDLSVVLENVHDRHNVSAVLRSCFFFDDPAAHEIYTTEEPPAGAFARTTSASAAKWIETHRHWSVDACFAHLRAAGFAILATALAEGSQDLATVDLRQPVALVFGNEMRGVSPEALAAADGTIAIPMLGMVQSLNISVACAVVLYEALRQRRQAGAYDHPKLRPDDLATRTEDWLTR